MKTLLRPTLTLVPLVAGCDLLSDGQDLFDGLTNPLVGLSLVLSVEEPENLPDGFDPSESGFEPGTAATVFLADAASAADIENAPVDGATVLVGAVEAAGQGQGTYLVTPADGLGWTDGGSVVIEARIGDGVATMNVTTPAAVDVDVPTTGVAGQALTVDPGAADVQAFLVVVIDASTGDVAYSNQPDDVQGLYELTQGDAEPVEIPGATFEAGTAYVIGTAGLVKSSGDGIDGMNTALSSAFAGKMVFQPYVIPPNGS